MSPRLFLPVLLLLSMPFLACEKGDYQRMAESFLGMKDKREVTVVLIGDSLSGSEYTSSDISWGSFLKTRLAELLGTRVSFINAIHPDETFDRATRHLQEDVFSFRPDAVIVMLGMNDSTEPNLDGELFRGITEKFFSILRYQGVCVIVLTTTGYRDALPGEESFAMLREFNDILSLQAKLQHLPVIDVARMMDDLREKEPETYRSLFLDSVHLNGKGQELVAGFVYDTIRRVMERGR